MAAVTGANVLKRLAELVFGDTAPENLAALRDALVRFQRSDKRVSRTAVANWFKENGSIPDRDHSRGFLRAYLYTALDARSLSPERQTAWNEIDAFLRAAPLTKVDQSDRAGSRRTQPDSIATAFIDVLLRKGVYGRVGEIDDLLFYCSPHAERSPNDQSYYLAFRYSTIKGAIVKTFFVCSRPRGGVEWFTTRHFTRGAPEDNPDVVRESRGVVLSYGKSLLFLSYTYTIPFERASDPEGFSNAQFAAMANPRALELFSVESEDGAREKGLLSAVTFSSAALDQPLVGRLALLHLGTAASLGRRIRDDDVRPTELPSDRVGGDLQHTVNHLQNLGCVSFGSTLQRVVARGWDTEASEALANRILGMIDNTPAWETSHSNLSRVAEGRAHGALETYSPIPGNRPRP
jgi:hypothetical protein